MPVLPPDPQNPGTVTWPMKLTANERAAVEELVRAHGGLVSRSAILRGLFRYALAAARNDPAVAVEHLKTA